MNTYFNIRYEFDKKLVWNRIASQVKAEKSDYICVADGVVLNIANRKPEYLRECSLFATAGMCRSI